MASLKVGSVIEFAAISLFTMTLVSLYYNPPLETITVIGILSGLVGVALLRNRDKNLRKTDGHESVFPNPLGGGLMTLYIYRPWMRELAEMDRNTNRKELRRYPTLMDEQRIRIKNRLEAHRRRVNN